MTHATSCDLLVRNGDCTCQTSHVPMRGVSETMRGYLRNTYSRTSWTLQVLDALEDTEAAWRRDAAEIAAVWDVLEKGYLQFLPIRHESLVANVQRLVEMAQELDSIREVEAGGGAE